MLNVSPSYTLMCIKRHRKTTFGAIVTSKKKKKLLYFFGVERHCMVEEQPPISYMICASIGFLYIQKIGRLSQKIISCLGLYFSTYFFSRQLHQLLQTCVVIHICYYTSVTRFWVVLDLIFLFCTYEFLGIVIHYKSSCQFCIIYIVNRIIKEPGSSTGMGCPHSLNGILGYDRIVSVFKKSRVPFFYNVHLMQAEITYQPCCLFIRRKEKANSIIVFSYQRFQKILADD